MRLRQVTHTSFDGTPIVYRVGGQGTTWLVIANGYGATFGAWEHVMAELASRYRLLIWDYRGFHRSGTPADRDRLHIPDHCRDLEGILDAEGIEMFFMAGWSVGVQVCVEQARRTPERIRALALLNGSHERVLYRSMGRSTAWLRLFTAQLLRPSAPMIARAIGPVVRRSGEHRSAAKLLTLLGFVASPSQSFAEALRSFTKQDLAHFFDLLLKAERHRTDDALPYIDVPTLVTGGSRDVVTPAAIGRHVANRMPNATFKLVPGGTHFITMESPRLVAELLQTLIETHA